MFRQLFQIEELTYRTAPPRKQLRREIAKASDLLQQRSAHGSCV